MIKLFKKHGYWWWRLVRVDIKGVPIGPYASIEKAMERARKVYPKEPIEETCPLQKIAEEETKEKMNEGKI